MKEKCKVEWCDRDAKFKGYCHRHYDQMRKWGEVRISRGDRNRYIVNDGFAEMVTYDKDYNEKHRVLIDIEDIERVKPYKWSVRNDGYVAAKIKGKGIKLHRFLAETPDGKHTDHINLDRLDNRKSNLRVCTQAQNNKNKGFYKNNKSGYKGVYFVRGKWHVGVTHNKKRHHIGCYDTIEEAIVARREGELKYIGEYARHNTEMS